MGATDTDESFLPQIVGLFYATFDPKLGPTVLHQVPENLITASSLSADDTRSRSRSASRQRRGQSPSVSSITSRRALLDFAPISEYVIPKKSLHGKLVSLLTPGRAEIFDDNATDDGRRYPRRTSRGGNNNNNRSHARVGGDDGDAAEERQTEYRVMGFPSVLAGEGGRYVRNEYMWNLCFVFEAKASLEAFEPVVRKCARILRSAEIDSAYLSAPRADHTSIPAVLEQLFEDLNSYSETSIPLDGFNSLELKLFPFYPNPPECEDWHVPIALVDLNALKDDNWDITAARVAMHINGVNHVRQIAQLADADPALCKETLRHMLFYQVVMMVDIFQYSNIYTLKPSIARLAAEDSIMEECAAYVTKRGFPHQPWPVLLGLYSKLLPGTTVHQWIEDNDVASFGIDARRFMSFGIIKGFLRRVHRWPIMVDRHSPLLDMPEQNRRRVEFEDTLSSGGMGRQNGVGSGGGVGSSSTRQGGDSGFYRAGDSTFTLRSMGSNASIGLGVSPSSLATRTPPSVTRSPARRPVGFTNVRDTYPANATSGAASKSDAAFPRSLGSASVTMSASAHEQQSQPSHSSRRIYKSHLKGGRGGGGLGGDDPSNIMGGGMPFFDSELVRYLDGTHHADEIQVRFGLGWKRLESVLGLDEIVGGKGKKGVTLLYR